MKFAIRLSIGSAGAFLIGVAFLTMNLVNPGREDEWNGGLWKGPLLMLGGAVGVVMGIRILIRSRNNRS